LKFIKKGGPILKSIFFESKDGLRIEGGVFEGKKHWVILAHGKAFDMNSWHNFALYLQEKGFTAMTFNFRGYGSSESKDHRYELDVIGAIRYASKHAEKISVIGASMGGTAVLRALEIYNGTINGMVLLSPAGFPRNFSALESKAKKAVVFYTKGDFAFDSSEIVVSHLPFPTEEKVFEGSSHAQNMLTDPIISKSLKEEIFGFLSSI
jgi:alpha-beta hydrolase superfamily lysophospholipase